MHLSFYMHAPQVYRWRLSDCKYVGQASGDASVQLAAMVCKLAYSVAAMSSPPLPSLPSPPPPPLLYRVTETSSRFFCLQKRRGHGEKRGFGAMVVGTWDNIRDSKPRPFRILLHNAESDFSYVVASAASLEEAREDWAWLQETLVPTLGWLGVK